MSARKKKSSAAAWTLGEGRTLRCDGVAVAYVGHVLPTRRQGHPWTASDTDALAQAIVGFLNDSIKRGAS